MGFRILSMGLEIRGYGIDLLIECLYFEIDELDLFRQFFAGILYLLTKDFMAFNDDVQFVLEMFGLDSNLMTKLGFHLFFKVKDDLFKTLEIFAIHFDPPSGQPLGVRSLKGVLRRRDVSGFFDSVDMGGCKIPSAMNDPDDVYLLRFDLVENPV